MDITGIGDLNAVLGAAETYKKNLKGLIKASQIPTANIVKGQGLYSAVSSYNTAVNDKIRRVIDYIDKLILSIQQLKGTYTNTVQGAGVNALKSSANKMKS